MDIIDFARHLIHWRSDSALWYGSFVEYGRYQKDVYHYHSCNVLLKTQGLSASLSNSTLKF